MGDLRAASHQSVPTLTTAPLDANATLLLELGFRWLRLRADQTIVSKTRSGQATRLAMPRALASLRHKCRVHFAPRCRAPATSMRAGRCLTVVRLSPSPCM